MTEENQQSVENQQKEHYIEIPEGASEQYGVQPKRKYGEKVIKGIIVGRGDHRAIINIDDVKKLAQLHLTYKDMAEYFGCKETTFRDNFRSIVEQSRQRTKQRLMEAMLHNAIDKLNPTMQIWLSRNLLNMSENNNNTEQHQILPWSSSQEEE